MPIEGRWYTTEEVANMLERQEQTISRAATRIARPSPYRPVRIRKPIGRTAASRRASSPR